MGDDIGSLGTRIEKLCDSNFHAWKQKIVLILALKDLDDFIENDPPTEEKELSMWMKNDRKARAIIGLSLSDEHLEHVRDVTTAKEMWKAIMNVFERHTLLNKLTARRKFYTVKMEIDEKVLTYLNRVKQLASTLKSMNIDIDDQETAMAALNGLPSSYESLIVALDAIGNDDKAFTFDLVKSRLLQEEQRVSERDFSMLKSNESAFVGVPGRNNGKSFGGSKPKNKFANHRCKNCGNFGHTEEACWGKDINGQRPPNPYKKSNAAFVGEHQTQTNDTKLLSESDYVCLMGRISGSSFPKGISSWITDSGCTAHICFDQSMFHEYESAKDMTVEMGTKATAEVVGKGSVVLDMQCGADYSTRRLDNVLHVPSFEYNLLSVSAIDKKGMSTTFGDGKVVIQKDGLTVATGSLDGTLYVMQTKQVPVHREQAFVSTLDLWHARMAHVDKRGIAQMANRGVVNGLDIKRSYGSTICDDCVVSKAHRSSIPKERSSELAKGILDRVHSDVCGPVETPSIGGSRYFVTFIDEHSNWVMVYMMKRKSEVCDRFLEFEKYAERQTGRKIRVLRSDRGGEYLSESLSKYFKHRGIVHELTAAYTPHQNGKAERFNRTCMNLVRAMLRHRDVQKRFWAEALQTATHIRNRVTSSALPSNTTPHHLWKDAVPNVSYLRVFGCKCWYTVPKSQLQKLDPRGKAAIFVGYAEASKAYKLIDLESHKIVISRDVVFDENSNVDFESQKSFEFADAENGETVSLDLTEDDSEVLIDDKDDDPAQQIGEDQDADSNHESSNNHDQPVVHNDNEEVDVSNEQFRSDSEDEQVNEKQPETVLRSGRVSKPPRSWWSALTTSEKEKIPHSAFIATATRDVPNSFKEATTGPDAIFWQKGIDSEIESLKQHKTWTVVPRSSVKGRKVLTTRWVFVEKQRVDEDGNTTPFAKGRNVVRGFQQVQGVDYGETFAPVVKYSSVRALCAKVADEDLELDQMDVITAFLNGDIDEDIYIEVPDGVEITPEDISHLGLGDVDINELDLVCKLDKSMYGTKQAPRCWNKKIHAVLADELSFVRSDGDPCLYVKQAEEGIMMIALYVDDLLIATKKKTQSTWIKSMLNDRFKMKDLGEAKVCLGLEINRDREQRKLWLTQQSYMEKILERFGMSASKPAPTPMQEPKSPESRPEVISETDEDADNVPYRQAIGSLMYLMIGSRPDIAYAVCKLSRFCERPKWKHWIAVKRVFRYVNGTAKMGLCFGGRKSEKLEFYDKLNKSDVFGYSDSDHAGDVSDRKSTNGYVFMMAGSAISWASKKQNIVTTSSCEAEYVGLTMACKEAIWVRRLLGDINIKTDLTGGITLLSDSESAMKLANNESINRRNKHIDIAFHFVRHATEDGQVVLGYIPTDEMVADIMTKALGKVKFEKLRRLSGLRIKGEY